MRRQYSIWFFFSLFFLYALISTFLFTVTAGGWTGLLLVAPAWLIAYGVTSLVLLVIAVMKTLQKKKKITLNTKILPFLLGAQVLTMLLNIGDCGDDPGVYAFWQVTLYGAEAFCWPNPGSDINTLVVFLGISIAIYVALLLMFLSSMKSADASSSPQTT